jgi:hypothetical protein
MLPGAVPLVQKYHPGGMYDWTLLSYKDGAVLSLVGGSATIYFKDPTGAVTSYAMTVNATGASYTNVAGLFTDVLLGNWNVQIVAIDSTGANLPSDVFQFAVWPNVKLGI